MEMALSMKEGVGLVHQLPFVHDRSGFAAVLEKVGGWVLVGPFHLPHHFHPSSSLHSTLSHHHPLTPSTHTIHSHHPLTPSTLTIHSHHPLSPSTLTIYSHHPLSPSTHTIHSHHLLSPSTLTIYSHHPLSPSTHTIHSHHSLSPFTLTISPSYPSTPSSHLSALQPTPTHSNPQNPQKTFKKPKTFPKNSSTKTQHPTFKPTPTPKTHHPYPKPPGTLRDAALQDLPVGRHDGHQLHDGHVLPLPSSRGRLGWWSQGVGSLPRRGLLPLPDVP